MVRIEETNGVRTEYARTSDGREYPLPTSLTDEQLALYVDLVEGNVLHWMDALSCVTLPPLADEEEPPVVASRALHK